MSSIMNWGCVNKIPAKEKDLEICNHAKNLTTSAMFTINVSMKG